MIRKFKRSRIRRCGCWRRFRMYLERRGVSLVLSNTYRAIGGRSGIPLFALLTVPSSRFSSPLFDAVDMLLGPVGLRVGTPPSAPDSFRAADLGDPPGSYWGLPARYWRSGLRCSLAKGLGFWSLPTRILAGTCGVIGSFGGRTGGCWLGDIFVLEYTSDVGDLGPVMLVSPLYRLVC